MSRGSNKPWFTIRKKLLIISLSLLILPIVSLGLSTYSVSVRETEAIVKDGLKNNVRLTIEMMGLLENSVQNGSKTLEMAQEEMRKLLLGEKKEDGSREINRKIDLGENGYFYVIDEKGKLLAHPSKEGENIWDSQSSSGVYYIQEAIHKGLEGGGFTHYSWPLPAPNDSEEGTKVIYSEVFSDWGWIVAAGSYERDFEGGIQAILSTMLLTLIICLAVGAIVVAVFSRNISRPLLFITAQSERMAEGDLTAEPLPQTRRDEMGRLTGAFNQLLEYLKQLVGNLKLSSNNLNTSARSLASVIAETTAAAQHTTTSISEVAHSSETQARSVQDASRAMQDMASGIQRIAEMSASAYDASTSTLEEAETGNQLVLESIEQMKVVSATMERLRAAIDSLGDNSREIGEIAVTIKEISSQTNMLALNAAIEASRAGEHGRGFAVVADEIRKLANRSNESAMQVEALTETIRGEIGDAMTSMAKGTHEVSEGVQAIGRTGTAFDLILNATRNTVDHVQEASAAAEQMSAGSEQISASLQEIEQSSVQTAGSAQSVSAATQEQLASLEEISASADRLNELAEAMRQLTSRFKL
ncbi:methyl-accepting chemotaxis protein [Paenibacillaceae bacterium]|nr:methyl-accepting chemotaxis protein [Paenibacillaceae bacterium]